MPLRLISLTPLILVLALTGSARASCVSDCDLACLWAEYLAFAREAADDMARAAHYSGGAADGYQQALDAARGELDAMVPSLEGMIQEGVIGEVCSNLLGQLERAGRAMEALVGIQGAGVLEAMAKVARRNAAWNWRIAKGRLTRYKWCCKNRPAAPPEDQVPPPTEPPEPKVLPPVTTESGERREPLSDATLDAIEAARDRYRSGGAVSVRDLGAGLHSRVLFWNVAAHRNSAADRAAGSMSAAAYSTDKGACFADLAAHPDALLAHEAVHVVQQRAPNSDQAQAALRKAAQHSSPEVKALATSLGGAETSK
jgi:hypothetical protein